MIRAITSGTASQAYKVLFWHLMERGEPFISEGGAKCRILDTVICHITKPMDGLPELIRISPLGPLAMDQYMRDFVYGVPDGDERLMNFEYTYHERLFEYEGENQIQNIITKLNRNPFTRRAVAVLWQPWDDIDSDEPPCLCLLMPSVSRDNKRVNMTCVFRSHDLIGGWINNVYALIHLLEYVAKQTDRVVGYLEVISKDGHLYMTDMDKVDRLKELLK